MRLLSRFFLAVVATCAGLVSSAHAQVVVQAPFVTVQVGNGGVYVRAPFVNLQFPRRIMAPPAETAPVSERIGDPIPVPLPRAGQTDFSVPVPLPRSTVSRPQTPREFAETFKTAPGSYDVVLLHPKTNQPVTVRFTLPEGQARQVRTFPRQINFDYGGRRDVTIRFLADGRVRVSN